MSELTAIYFFPLDEAFLETGEVIPVALNEDGSADLSKLPTKLRSHLESFGVIDELHKGMIMPKDGERFLSALLVAKPAHWHFRETAEASS